MRRAHSAKIVSSGVPSATSSGTRSPFFCVIGHFISDVFKNECLPP